MKNGIVEQVEELLKGAVTPEELAEMEKVIQEAKGKVRNLVTWVTGKAKHHAGRCAIVRPRSTMIARPTKSVTYRAGKMKAPIVNSMITVQLAAIRASARSAASIRDMAIMNPSRLKGLERDWFPPSPSIKQINNVTETTGSGRKRCHQSLFQPDNGYN